MKKNLANRLSKFGFSLESTRFGIYGDWCVIGNGTEKYFTTLGRVCDFVTSLEMKG